MTNRTRKILPLAVFAAAFILLLAIFLWNREHPTTPTTEPMQSETPPVQQRVAEQPVLPPPAPVPTPQAETAAPPQAEQAQPEEAREIDEDSVFTFGFLADVASTLSKHYQPAGTGSPARKAGTTTATFKRMNMTYGLGLHALNINSDDIREARSGVLDHLFTPGIVRALHETYADYFVDLLVAEGLDTTKNFADDGERTMNEREVADMLLVYAPILRQTASVFQAIAGQPETMRATARYQQAAARVEAANARFQEALVAGSADTGKASAELKAAITNRERIRSAVITAIEKTCKGCSDPNETFYIAQWVQRRIQNHPERLEVVAESAKALDDLADRLTARAGKLQSS